MTEMLDLVRLEEFLPLVVLCLILLFIADKVTRPDAGVLTTSRRLTAVTFVVYLAAGTSNWRPSNATELLIVVLKACMAAGIVFAIAILVLGVVATTIVDPFGRIKGWFRRMYVDAEDRMKQRKAEQARFERQRREQLDERRRRSEMERERQHNADEAARRERERHSRTDEARAEVIRFYDLHAADLTESLPPPLFRSKLQTSFPEEVTPQRAWQEAQILIDEMLPMLVSAAEKRRAVDEEKRKEEERLNEARHAEQAAADRRHAVSRLTDWYEAERAAIEARLPEGQQRVIVLQELYDRYDQLVKEALQEIRP